MVQESLSIKVQPVAPDYKLSLCTISDPSGFETRWMFKNVLTSESLEDLKACHQTISQDQQTTPGRITTLTARILKVLKISRRMRVS